MIKSIKILLVFLFPMSGIKLGDIDVGDQVVDNEFRIKFLTKLIEWLVNHNMPQKPTPEQIQQMRTEALDELKTKYPNSGIGIKS